MTRDDVVALQQRDVDSVKIPFPFLSGASWRVLGLATVTIVDIGGGTFRAYVKNNFPHTINAVYKRSFDGKPSQTIQVVKAGILAYLQFHPPPGVDPLLEVQINDTP
jgi:hypothetical protein